MRNFYVYTGPATAELPVVIAESTGKPVTVAAFKSAADASVYVTALRAAGHFVAVLPSAERVGVLPAPHAVS